MENPELSAELSRVQQLVATLPETSLEVGEGTITFKNPWIIETKPLNIHTLNMVEVYCDFSLLCS